MKKSLLAIAVAATMAAPLAVMAETTVYGNVHLSINAANSDDDANPVKNVGAANPPVNQDADNNLQMTSNTSAIGVKGSEDLGDGMKAIYKLEFEVNITDKTNAAFPDLTAPNGSSNSGTLSGRDQFVGLQGGFGTLAFGTMSSNYKQMGGKIDPLYRTQLEGRGFLNTQSTLHGGKGINKGRQTNTVQYTSPKFAGVSVVANTTFSGSNDETSGLGLRWSNKEFTVFADYITGQKNTLTAVENCNGPACSTEHAIKGGAQYKTDKFSLAAQYESAENETGADYIFVAGTYSINANNEIILTGGNANTNISNADTTGVAVAFNHNLSKLTNVYAGYGLSSSDASNADLSLFTFGIKKKF